MKKEAIKYKIKRAKHMARTGTNPDFKLQHPDWVREAQNNKFSDLELKLKQSITKLQERAQKRRDKLGGK